MTVGEYEEDIRAIDQTVNLINMMSDARISKVVSVDYFDDDSKIGKYKVNLPIYELGLASILVNRTTHEVIGLYGKLAEFEDNKDILVGAKLDIATECIIIEVIRKDGTILKSIPTGKNVNCYCAIYEGFVRIGNDKYELN